MEPYLVFMTDGERFALPANVVEEVIERPNVRRLAGLPAHVAGVLLHRGIWLPAIDAAARLGLEAQPGRVAALVVRRGRSRFALTADAVLGIREWAETGDMGVAATDLGLVTPVDPNLLFRNEVAPDEEVGYMPAASATVSIVVFRMSGEEFGADISNVVEVLEYREPVHVPRAPEFVVGVVQVRDSVLPVIDLRKRMEVALSPPSADTRIIVVLIDEERVGLLVDSVVEVAHMSSDNVSQPPAFFRGVSAEYLQGLARIGDRMVIVLRLERVLTSQERIALLRADYSEAEPEAVAAATATVVEPAATAPEGKRGRRSSK
jgi:purine-binding chemotaxis protein CheW